MKTENETQIMQLAIDTWGKRAQFEMAQEEATELALAVRKFIRVDTEQNYKNLASEIADVEIMIKQIKFMLPNIEKVIEEQKVFKITRLKDRLDKLLFEDPKP